MSMPSLDFFRSSAPTEVLRVESEPPGADARTAQGETCRTPCELTVPSTTETAITFALNGYQPMTIPVRADDSGGGPRLQPNPVYAELQPAAPSRPGRKRPAVAKKPAAKKATSAAAQGQAPAPEPAAAPSAYPWPPAPQ
jgi:hypothetical protein